MAWISTADFAQLIDPNFPADAATVRGWCEEGLIPSRYAKRRPGRERAKWFIATAGIMAILKDVLQLEHDEICEVQLRSRLNFNCLDLAAVS